MNYVLNVRTRPNLDEIPRDFIDRVVRRLRQLGPPWGLKPGDLPSPRSGKSDPLTIIKLTKHLGEHIKGEMVLRNRDWTLALPNPDQPSCDDYIIVDFDPRKVVYEDLAHHAFPAYVEATGAYFGEIAENGLRVDEFDRWRESENKGRNGVFRIWPVNFWDTELCRRAFGLTPGQVVQRVGAHVESAKVFKGGALITVTSKVMPKDEIAQIDGRIRPLLND
jgi:hypothetical protein